MATIKTADIANSLTKKGFQLEETHHHIYHYMDGDRRTSVRTFLSHGIKEYGEGLIGSLKKQMRLTKPQLLQFVACPLTAEEYKEILIEGQHIQIESGQATTD